MIEILARATGLEPATSGVTGRLESKAFKVLGHKNPHLRCLCRPQSIHVRGPQ